MSDAPAESEPARSEGRERAAFGRYRVMAFVTGGMLLLLTLEIVLKYLVQVNGFGEPVIGSWVAMVHGWIYVIYLVTVFDLWSKMRWGFGRMIALIAAGVVPVLSFVMEHQAKAWVEETLAAR